ncbi:alpha/beta fold hydrolase [Ramlibacter rhizophilus]|uniref:Alpha/beta hydrolase n=1 Tax=Ramlibacter rhizophilus TaxID=1781167 RepID=A0A4Z0BGP0_9BURK|nr:alpha/beta hydrolase [Ramlibacter rhizophilus]TFY98472.1 alpha/beta hydrolase [Ramlibacter rhizophilus]
MFLQIDGHKIFALSFGSGERTLLAHGGWISNFEDWIDVVALLSSSWRVVVYDHRGSGESPVPVEAITSESLVDDVFRVMDAMQIDRCILGGFSRGTATVLRAAVQQPQRFDGLVLLNGHGEVRDPSLPVATRIAPSKWPGETHEEHLRWFIERCTPEEDVDHIRRWGMHILFRSPPDIADRLFMVEFQDKIDWPTRLATFSLPTLLIHGQKDALFDVRNFHYLDSLLPNSKFVELEGSGHLPAMVRPKDVAHEIKTFFERT